MTDQEHPLLTKARERGLSVTQPPAPSFAPEDIPESEAYEPTPEEAELDRVIGGIDIIDAYRRWCGKSEPKDTGRTEGIKVSCPNPSHPDTDPSAWINTEKQVYFCGGCQEGGDKFDIAAWHFGMGVPGYKQPGQFPELKRKMASEFGFTVSRTPGGQTYVVGPDSPESADSPTESSELVSGESDEPPKLAQVIQLPPPPDEPSDMPSVPWREIVPTDTFLHRWLTSCQVSDLPEEYYFWLGLQTLGFAAGTEVVLADRPPVKGNLYVCLYGPSGLGKSKSIGLMRTLLRDAMPYGDAPSRGTKIVPQPGSPEAMIDSFSEPMFDPTDPGKMTGLAPVRGLVRFDELATLIGRSQRAGSTFKQVLMEFYDAYDKEISHHTRGSGVVVAYDPLCQVVTSTQPEVIRDLLTQQDADAGFVNRWVFAAGPNKPLHSYGGEDIDISDASASLRTVVAWVANHAGALSLSVDARLLWDQFFNDALVPVKTASDLPILSRVDLTLKKLMLLYAINEHRTEVSVDIVERVIPLYDYLRKIYLMLAGQIGIGASEACRADLIKVVREHEAKTNLAPTNREISRYMPKRHPKELVLKMINTLVQLGELEESVSKPDRGRPTVRYRYIG